MNIYFEAAVPATINDLFYQPMIEFVNWLEFNDQNYQKMELQYMKIIAAGSYLP